MEKYYLLGHPLGHSMSPFIHNALFAYSKREAQLCLLDSADLQSALPTLFAADGFAITIPYKTEIISHLTGCAPSALELGSVNVVGKDKIGHNTDSFGFLQNLQSLLPRLDKTVLLLGFGGVGLTFAGVLLSQGASLTIAVKDVLKTVLSTQYNFLINKYPDCDINVVDIDAIPQTKYDLLVNATPVGMFPDDNSPLLEQDIEMCDKVFDCVYNPTKTKLLRLAKGLGKECCGGIAMLVWQAVAAHKIWYGGTFDNQFVLQLIASSRAELDLRYLR